MLGRVAMTAKNLKIGRIIRASFGERDDVVNLQSFRRAARHAFSLCAVEQREYVINRAMTAILLASVAASYLHALPSVPSVWISGDPVGYNLPHPLLVLATPSLLVLAVALWIGGSPSACALAILRDIFRVSRPLFISRLVGKPRTLHAATTYAARGYVALRARLLNEVGFEAALYGLRARDDFHAMEITP